MADLPDDWDNAPEFDATNSAEPDAAGMLKVSRAVLGLTQQRLADLMDIPLATLRNWEQRRTVPDDAARTLITLLFRHPREVAAMLETDRAA